MTSIARWGRAYFAVQAAAGAVWWVAVFSVAPVRELTLGRLDPVTLAVFDIPLFVVASALAAARIRLAASIATAWTLIVAAGLAVYATVTGEAGWGVLVMAAAAVASAAAWCAMVLGRIPTEWVVRGPFAFRAADARRTVRRNVAATFGQIAMFWGLFLVAIPLAISALEQRWQVGAALPEQARVVASSAGLLVLVAASALGIWSAIAMSTIGGGTPLPSAMTNRLVVAGPYRFVRNPMAVAGIAQGAAVGLLLSSWLVVAYALAGSVVWNHVVRPHEEADLERRFGAEFERYRSAVPCWRPRLTPYRPETAAPPAPRPPSGRSARPPGSAR